jgi:hypothetical protein
MKGKGECEGESEDTGVVALPRRRKLPWKLQVVLTKCDVVERSVLGQRLTEIHDALGDGWLQGFDSNLPVLCTSLGRPGPAFRGKGDQKCLSFRDRHAGVVALQKELASLIPAPQHMYKPEKKGKKRLTFETAAGAEAAKAGMAGGGGGIRKGGVPMNQRRPRSGAKS